MPYRYPAARSLDKQPKVGDFECVTLIRHYTNAPPANMWRQGAKVLGNKDLSPGTAIANFENGRWPAGVGGVMQPSTSGKFQTVFTSSISGLARRRRKFRFASFESSAKILMALTPIRATMQMLFG